MTEKDYEYDVLEKHFNELGIPTHEGDALLSLYGRFCDYRTQNYAELAALHARIAELEAGLAEIRQIAPEREGASYKMQAIALKFWKPQVQS